jgi:hypothetical protein
MAPTLSRRPPCAVHMHVALARRFGGFIIRRSQVHILPPPREKVKVRALLGLIRNAGQVDGVPAWGHG